MPAKNCSRQPTRGRPPRGTGRMRVGLFCGHWPSMNALRGIQRALKPERTYLMQDISGTANSGRGPGSFSIDEALLRALTGHSRFGWPRRRSSNRCIRAANAVRCHRSGHSAPTDAAGGEVKEMASGRGGFKLRCGSNKSADSRTPPERATSVVPSLIERWLARIQGCSGRRCFSSSCQLMTTTREGLTVWGSFLIIKKRLPSIERS
jgi:hypothetical protein